ncbi:MAG: pentapeptide repeat-containing protein [Candidatus Limnocylindria bacterium]
MSIAEMGLPGLVLLQRATLANVDFGRASFDRMAPSGCLFLSCDFRKARLDRRMLPIFKAKRRNIFRECRFDGADMRAIDPGSSRFERCTFDGADMGGWTAATAEFVDCHFAGRLGHVRFYGKPWGPGADLLEPRRTANDFSGNDFRGAELVDVAFLMGIDIGKQRWPEGDEYVRLDRIHQRLTRGRTDILRWKDLEARGQALQMFQSLSFLYMQQNDVVARRDDPETSASPEVQARVWDALTKAL